MAGKIIRYLGIDWGEKRIGLALGDSETGVATPFEVAGGVDEVVHIIKEEGIDVAVVGKPLRMASTSWRGQCADPTLRRSPVS